MEQLKKSRCLERRQKLRGKDRVRLSMNLACAYFLNPESVVIGGVSKTRADTASRSRRRCAIDVWGRNSCILSVDFSCSTEEAGARINRPVVSEHLVNSRVRIFSACTSDVARF